jgi:2-oxoglutarate dehydrogenase E2 component (dihydrolipoamide succinyltransferase)
MPVNIVVPELGESVLEATVGRWRKQTGDHVSPGDVVVELETDKVDLEVGAERAGVLSRIERQEGEDVRIGDVLGVIEESSASTAGAEKQEAGEAGREQAAEPKPSPPAAPTKPGGGNGAAHSREFQLTAGEVATPSARRLARERGLNLSEIPVASASQRVTPQEVKEFIGPPGKPRADKGGDVTAPLPSPAQPDINAKAAPVVPLGREERVRMSRRRQTIAQRLVVAQRTAAILTTFNEIDMTSVMELRKRQKQAFQERYGTGLGVVSFFVKASVVALREFPRLNSEIQGNEIVLKHYYDIGVAVGAEEGLVVPVVRGADRMSFAEIERAIKEFARKAREGTLALDDLRGGTFSVSNGGVFGSLLSTPILNPPQSGILGLHKIEERPVAVEGAIVLRPMMYVALSYDHRIVDGLEAVRFLVRVKELVEDPGTLLVES